MKIAIVSPLYPPDIAEPAPYTKELAKRLSIAHEVTVLTYGTIPEEIRAVRILHTSKQRPLPIRLISFTYKLWSVSRSADILYVQNGPSVELPTILVSLLTRAKIIVCIGDVLAHNYAKGHRLLRYIEKSVFLVADAIVVETEGIISQKKECNVVALPTPGVRPEILPFEDAPAEKMARWNTEWEEHISALIKLYDN